MKIRLQLRCLFGLGLLSFGLAQLHADQVEMQNGDRYFGKVLSLTNDTLLFRSEVLGTVRLPRDKVARVGLGAAGPTNLTALPELGETAPLAQAGTNAAASDIANRLSKLGTNSFLLKQVESQFLNGATPEAKDKFNELFTGLISGKLSVSDIRAQAQSAAERLRAARKDLGSDAGWMIDSYLAILDHFVKETTPAVPSGTPGPSPKPKSSSPAEQE